MKIAVVGLWHLGTIVSLCMSKLNNIVYAFDDKRIVNYFNKKNPPINEKGVENLLKKNINKKLYFDNDLTKLKKFKITWITYDAQINDDDKSDFNNTFIKIKNVLKYVRKNSIILISTQLPLGSIKKIETYERINIKKKITFIYLPENLRLGKSIKLFLKPDRIVIGMRPSLTSKKIVLELFKNIYCKKIIVSPETAEMSKHAINSFLACSVSFINEIGQLSKNYNISQDELEECVKTDKRIGKFSYLRPGNAFSGGTLARDLNYLIKKAKHHKTNHKLIKSIYQSNIIHSKWLQNILNSKFKSKKNKILQIGLSYTKNTSTIRRSLPYKNFIKLKKKYFIRVYDKYLEDKSSEINHLKKFFLKISQKEKFNIVLIFSKINNLSKFKKIIEKNAAIIDVEGSNKKCVFSNKFSYISLENG